MNNFFLWNCKDKSSVCFADYCDIMRCDILAGRRKKEFWDVSLCLESDMKDLMDDCEVIMFIPINICNPSYPWYTVHKNIYQYIGINMYMGSNSKSFSFIIQKFPFCQRNLIWGFICLRKILLFLHTFITVLCASRIKFYIFESIYVILKKKIIVNPSSDGLWFTIVETDECLCPWWLE